MTDYDLGAEITKLKKSNGFFRVKSEDDTFKYLFVRNCKITYDDSNVHVDNPGIKPIFTRLTDEVGTFEFTMGNTVDLYDTALNSDKVWLFSNWMEGIRDTNFVEMDFVRESVSKSGQRVLLQSTFRVKLCADEYDQGETIDDIIVSGSVLDNATSKAIKVV